MKFCLYKLSQPWPGMWSVYCVLLRTHLDSGLLTTSRLLVDWLVVKRQQLPSSTAPQLHSSTAPARIKKSRIQLVGPDLLISETRLGLRLWY